MRAKLTYTENRTVAEALKMTRLVTDKLRGLNIGDGYGVEKLAADFGDLYSAFQRSSCLLDDFISPDRMDRQALADILVDLEIEFRHIQSHMRTSKTPMGKLIDMLYGEDNDNP